MTVTCTGEVGDGEGEGEATGEGLGEGEATGEGTGGEDSAEVGGVSGSAVGELSSCAGELAVWGFGTSRETNATRATTPVSR